MFLELCLVLRIVLNENQVVLKNSSTVPCAATRETLRDIPQETTIKTHKEDKNTVSQDENANLKDLWVYRPLAQELQAVGVGTGGGEDSRVVQMRAPHSVTKLAKTMDLRYGFDPYFSKGYFEPFERRPKLVTLVAFRKNGLIPRKTVKVTQEKTAEVAELQSPFNGISNFWMDIPAENPA